MSTWTTKALNRDRKYVVLKHPLKGVNYSVQGVKFRHGFAVVEQDSKVHNMLKKMPILRNAEVLPLSFLTKLPFITRHIDIKIVYGQDVYRIFLQEAAQAQAAIDAAAKEEAELIHTLNDGCQYRLKSSNLCQLIAIPNSPSQYCSKHFLDDPKFKELNIIIPTKFMTGKEEEKLREKILEQLAKAKVTNGKVLSEPEESEQRLFDETSQVEE